jgi:hypothetical protein
MLGERAKGTPSRCFAGCGRHQGILHFAGAGIDKPDVVTQQSKGFVVAEHRNSQRFPIGKESQLERATREPISGYGGL